MLLGIENKGSSAVDFVFWRKLGMGSWLPLAFLCQVAGKLQTGLAPRGAKIHEVSPSAPARCILGSSRSSFLLSGKGVSGHLPPRWPLPDGAHPPLQQQEAVTTVQPHGSCRMSTNGPRAWREKPPACTWSQEYICSVVSPTGEPE